eukprot:scaffold70957_cov19-Tisochrysis_lutea.AAC.2
MNQRRKGNRAWKEREQSMEGMAATRILHCKEGDGSRVGPLILCPEWMTYYRARSNPLLSMRDYLRGGKGSFGML